MWVPRSPYSAECLTHISNCLLTSALPTPLGTWISKWGTVFPLTLAFLRFSLCKQNHHLPRLPTHFHYQRGPQLLLTPSSPDRRNSFLWAVFLQPVSFLSVRSTESEAALHTLLLKILHPLSKAFKVKFKSNLLTIPSCLAPIFLSLVLSPASPSQESAQRLYRCSDMRAVSCLTAFPHAEVFLWNVLSQPHS